jgi:hypothetical protein
MRRYRDWLALVSAVLALGLSLGNVLFVQRVSCTIVRANVSVYEETPPTTSAGRNARDSWLSLDRRLYC